LVYLPSLHRRCPSHPKFYTVSQTLISPEMSKHLYFLTSPHVFLLLTSRPQVLVAVACLVSIGTRFRFPVVVISVPNVVPIGIFPGGPGGATTQS